MWSATSIKKLLGVIVTPFYIPTYGEPNFPIPFLAPFPDTRPPTPAAVPGYCLGTGGSPRDKILTGAFPALLGIGLQWQ